MSRGTCYSGSNNIHFDFPPIMMDGRNFADWQPGAVINEKMRNEANIKTNSDYRYYVMNNADKIIKYNQMQACDKCCNCPSVYNDSQNQVTSNPYLYKSCSDVTKPFGYEMSDLKNEYLSRQALESRLNIPLLTQEKMIKMGYKNVN